MTPNSEINIIETLKKENKEIIQLQPKQHTNL